MSDQDESFDYGRWQEIKSLFGEALSIPPVDRESWLARVCGRDPALYNGVRKLLADQPSVRGFLDPQAGDASAYSLPPGILLAERFEILRQIGRGGMGEVYEVRDTALGETLALKTLRRDIGAEPGFASRFRRELQLSRQITHSNVCRVSEFHETHDPAGRPLSFFTMELLAGETLASRIGRTGKLTKAEALPLIRQIALGLEEVHRAGIVHRDLKPSNIMLVDGPGGRSRVVLMDFGLARSNRPGAVNDTRTGLLMGTPAYMAPEQFNKGIITPACDLYSLGVTIFEMLTGRNHPLFTSPSATPELDPQIESILSRCLDPDPQRRPDSAMQVVEALETLPVRNTKAVKWLFAGLGIVVCMVVAAFWLWTTPTSGGPPGSQASRRVPVITQRTVLNGLTIDPSATPDGKFLVYASDRRRVHDSGVQAEDLNIWMEGPGKHDLTQLTDAPWHEDQPAISPDGKLLAYRSGRDNALYVKRIPDGPVRRIAQSGIFPKFSPDGTRIAYTTGQQGELGNSAGRVFVFALQDGTTHRLADRFWEARYPVWSPDGREILFAGLRASGGPENADRELWVVPEHGGEVRATGVVRALKPIKAKLYDCPPAWDGNRLVFAARVGHATNLYEVAFSARQNKIAGSLVPLTTSEGFEATPILLPDGQVVFSSLSSSVDVYKVDIRTHELQAVNLDSTNSTMPSVSRNGRRLVFGRRQGNDRAIFCRDLFHPGTEDLQITQNDLAVPWVSPDGKRVGLSLANRISVFEIETRKSTELCSDCGQIIGWMPDDSAILFRRDRDGETEIGLLDFVKKTRRTVLSGEWLKEAAVSPDGRSILFDVQERGVNSRVFIKLLAGEGSGAPLPLTEPGTWSDHPTWSNDGSTAFYFSNRDGFQCIWQQKFDPVRITPQGGPQYLRHFHQARLTPDLVSRNAEALSADAKYVYLNVGQATGNLYTIQK